MKICMLAPEFLPVWGGVGTYIVELTRHLPKNVSVHVVTPMRHGFGKVQVSTSDYDFSTYFGGNVHVHFVGNANDTFLYNARFQYSCLKYVPKLVKEESIDIIHSHTAHMPDLLLQLRNIKTPIVTTIHTTIRGQRQGTKSSGMDFGNLERSERLTYLMYPLLMFAESVYFLKNRHYITVSHWMKRQAKKQYSRLRYSDISVIHNAVDTRQFSPAGREGHQRDIVLYTGRLIAAKGIKYLVEAIPKVLREHPETLFFFIGPGDSLPYQRQLIELGIPLSNVSFLGYLKEARDLVNYYRAATIYVAPTLYENLPIRVLEAMACGIPVIASDICAIPEAIHDGENGILVEPGSVNELAEAICSLLGHPETRREIGDKARKTVLEKFDWDISARKTLEVYQRILSDSCFMN